ncbi:alpha-hydroxy acid oxidase [Novosphingobium sp. PASSN1]|uniref:alpha-hydroxy acid oxidase n=1 Tax=Novosphingobium sp. PASSN1 TaxID=2015561 RepID=UPI0025DE3CC0|nr:alpha-hydroxy acid oxidase [Novosphingobium sp. PASSN1]
MAHPYNIEMLRKSAARKLPRPIFDYIEGGAEDESALRRSTGAYDQYQLLPRALQDVSNLELGTRLFGCEVAWPLMLGPTGLTRLFHRNAELAVARAAGQAGLPYCLSTLGTTTIEEVAQSAPGPKLFQIYIFKDRGLTVEFVDRAREAGYSGLVLTIDTLMSGKRERDRRNGLSLPPRLTPRSFVDFALRPAWSIPALFGRKFDFVNLAHRVEALSAAPTSLYQYADSQFDRSLTWKDVEWLARQWDGPLAVKGILTADDARLAGESGADTVMVSNHGGRQLDGAASPIDQIGPIADAVSGRLTIICDGGIRRGEHIAKALALGADACSIGRPYLYGLAAGGERGVSCALNILREEYERTLVLMGASGQAALSRSMISHRPIKP